MQITGLHHVTAITATAAENLAFYTQVLGLRLVKKTVNQDDVSAYHLFYGDRIGSAGTEVTFFDWPQIPQNRNGAGSIARISLRVSGREALNWWAQRLAGTGVKQDGLVEAGGQAVLRFTDPEGLELELASDGGASGGTPWERSPVPAEMSIRGLNAVHLLVSDLEPLARVLTGVMGFERLNEYEDVREPGRRVAVFATAGGGPGTEVHVGYGPNLLPTRLGYGGVHHVAFRTPNDEEHESWREKIAAAGLQITPVIDRYYFKSIYFRVPGGVLFEIATDGPGFATDEDVENLGETLALPPFLEPHRARIEAGLRPLVVGSRQ